MATSVIDFAFVAEFRNQLLIKKHSTSAYPQLSRLPLTGLIQFIYRHSVRDLPVKAVYDEVSPLSRQNNRSPGSAKQAGVHQLAVADELAVRVIRCMDLYVLAGNHSMISPSLGDQATNRQLPWKTGASLLDVRVNKRTVAVCRVMGLGGSGK